WIVRPVVAVLSKATAAMTDLLGRACAAQRYLFARSSLADQKEPGPGARGQGFEEHAHFAACLGRQARSTEVGILVEVAPIRSRGGKPERIEEARRHPAGVGQRHRLRTAG